MLANQQSLMKQYNIDAAVLLESMSESILVTDTNLDEPGPFIIYVNPAFEKMTGWSRTEIIGKSPRILQGPKTDNGIFNDLKEKLENGETWCGRTINYRKDGSEFHMEWSITPVINAQGNIYQYIAVQKEVTGIVLTELSLQEAKQNEKKRILQIEKTNKKLSALVDQQNKTVSLFMKYVPEQVIKRALSDETENITYGARLDVALLFCDIRGFTAIAERLNPGQVVKLLNIYYTKMAEVIEKYDGVINEFTGDEIFVSFGAPVPITNPEISAVKCSLAMIETMKDINETLQTELDTTIKIGIGINFGSVIAGNLGSKHKLKYSITGSPVITAKRIESLTVKAPNSVLISQKVYDKVCNVFRTKPWGKISIKGKDEKINVYQVLGMN